MMNGWRLMCIMDNTPDTLGRLLALCGRLGVPVPPAPQSAPAPPPSPRENRTAGVFTSVCGDNAELMERIASLYFKPGYRIADVTYGRGVFWRDIDVTQFDFFPSDLKTCPQALHDCRHLPYPDAWFDVVIIDPPYMHGAGPPGIERCYRNAETQGLGHTGIMRLYKEGMAEGKRILKQDGLLLVKCQDEVESGNQRRSHIEVYEIARRSGMVDQDLFVLTRRHTPLIQSPKQRHARKNHSFMWLFKNGG
jgi:hypothetical protein